MSAEGLARSSARRATEANASEIRSMGDLDEGFDCKSAYSRSHALQPAFDRAAPIATACVHLRTSFHS